MPCLVFTINWEAYYMFHTDTEFSSLLGLQNLKNSENAHLPFEKGHKLYCIGAFIPSVEKFYLMIYLL